MKMFGYRVSEILVHGALLLATFCTATTAGVFWANRDPVEITNLPYGFTYAVLVILVLGAHEMGHLLAARLNGIGSTLPFFLPFPSFLGLFPFGTLGAVIRLRTPVNSKKSLLDIGAAGPIVGFVASTIVLVIGFQTLPAKEYLFSIHPEYANMESIPQSGLTFGNSIWYNVVQTASLPPNTFVPPMNEIYHYPFLCVGWLGLLVTSMNLIPIGQLDGGHIALASLGKRSKLISVASIITLLVLGGLGLWGMSTNKPDLGWPGWLLWAILLLIFTKGLRENKAPFQDDQPLTPLRLLIAVICVFILVVTFSPSPIVIR